MSWQASKPKRCNLLRSVKLQTPRRQKNVEQVIAAMPLLAGLPERAINSEFGQVAVQALRGALHAIASLHNLATHVPEIVQPVGQAAAQIPVEKADDDDAGFDEAGDDAMGSGTDASALAQVVGGTATPVHSQEVGETITPAHSPNVVQPTAGAMQMATQKALMQLAGLAVSAGNEESTAVKNNVFLQIGGLAAPSDGEEENAFKKLKSG
jgi:hypothetical protein